MDLIDHHDQDLNSSQIHMVIDLAIFG